MTCDLIEWRNLCDCDSFLKSISSPSCACTLTECVQRPLQSTRAETSVGSLCREGCEERVVVVVRGRRICRLSFSLLPPEKVLSQNDLVSPPETLHPLSGRLGAFPLCRAVRTLREYRRRSNSFSIVPSQINVSNSETEMVVFLSVN